MSKLDTFTPDPNNANKGTQEGRVMLGESIKDLGAGRSILVDSNGVVIAGNKTLEAATKAGIEDALVVETDGTRLVVVKRTDLDLTKDKKAKLMAIADNRVAELDLNWDTEVLESLSTEVDLSRLFPEGFDLDVSDVGEDYEPGEYQGEGYGDEDEPEAPDKVELREGVELGSIWALGRHRVMCGDSTIESHVRELLGDACVVLVHADPPYGMGKEKDGVQNDNLYRDKLCAFQMAWWGSVRPSLDDNASAYIWGNAEELWRLWYVGGLKDSERLTLRNEVVWNKYDRSICKPTVIEMMRSYCNYSERCLFFMLGEQGFNNNADNYWEGWEPIRAYLAGEAKAMKWGAEDVHRICETANTGAGMYSHWFTESQWTFIPERRYKALQTAAKGKAFKRDYEDLKRDYEDLKRDFYATRAYFDNTHDNMTDVWDFPRVQGEERWGHSTPKPVDMIARIYKSSSPGGGVIYSPFLGSGTDIIAAQKVGGGRTCYGMELSPEYIEVILQRWETFTGETAQRIN